MAVIECPIGENLHVNYQIYDTSGQALPAGRSGFYEVVLHELGHVHAIKHINGPDKLVYWHAIQSSSKTDYLDRNIFIHGGTLDGGVDVINASTNNNFSGACYNGNVIKYSEVCCIIGRQIANQEQIIYHLFSSSKIAQDYRLRF